MGEINVRKIINNLREKTLNMFSEHNNFGTLNIIQIDEDPASSMYVKSKVRQLEKWNIDTSCMIFYSLTYKSLYRDDNWSEKLSKDIIKYIKQLNNDNDCTGIIIQLPLPKELLPYKQNIINSIDPYKNVDGFVQTNSSFEPYSLFKPCTAEGILYILDNVVDTIENKTICLIGRGETVGKPLIDILTKTNCTLICCNSSTSNNQLVNAMSISDIVIAAANKSLLFDEYDFLNKNKKVIIDAGMTCINGHQVGNFDSRFVTNNNIEYTPWIGGVGVMTVAMLACNIIKAYELKKFNLYL